MKKRILTIDDLSTSLVKMNSRILELGSGDGGLSARLKKNNKCFVVSVEKDRNKAKIGKKFTDVIIVGDAESAEIQREIKRLGKYDVLYASAFLAHLVDPKNFLIIARKWIAPEGYLVATFPNHAHWIIRKNLLFGRFEYEQSGLYDRTHLHLFTNSSIRMLLNESGFEIESWNMEPYGFWRLEKLFFFVPKKIFRRMYALLPNFFAYQFVVRAKLK